ncbi:hypothetical protein RBSH_01120 [Rhodopirellula baltica SH28]|uniref:Uncharacterized protein n=1 Tax=Rhodopirellula baltica SH28 TaxID=993517 RepID=K5ECS0_RHOBT|nr:hypothetical protein RBSH_01120 [Rhodopirellula baltica SH28]
MGYHLHRRDTIRGEIGCSGCKQSGIKTMGMMIDEIEMPGLFEAAPSS